MNASSFAIMVFCCRLACDGAAPLEAKEWGDLCSLATDKGVLASELTGYSLNGFKSVFGLSDAYAERLVKLIGREPRLERVLGEYESAGVTAVTRADGNFPQRLKNALGNSCPPILYCMGDMRLLNGKYAGFVGSRKAEEQDEAFTRTMVKRTSENGYGVVSGGARGVDSFAESAALYEGCGVTEFPAEGIMRRTGNKEVSRAVNDGGLLLLSAAVPDAAFCSVYAIMRNRYIYAASSGAIAVRSDLNRGGTWSGATDNLKHGFCPQFCWNNAAYAGNAALIKRGAIPIDFTFGGDLEAYAANNSAMQTDLF